MLHEASRVKPPLQVVSDLIHYDRNVLSEVDEKGQTPLHIAAANDASFEVIEYLMHEFPEAAGMCDHRGKGPLMLLCENYSRQDELTELSGILISAFSHRVATTNMHVNEKKISKCPIC
mmetsp:Transcript_9114/g.10529  ORF Transcript_9114/g.10529 Transcript_9114/m.10529 type:complete len:119 (+) Transcript_9114:78-434(+)